jgi:hypothetical protein
MLTVHQTAEPPLIYASGVGGASIVPPPATGHRYASPGSDIRTISLGICTVRGSTGPDLQGKLPLSDRESPSSPRLMARQWPGTATGIELPTVVCQAGRIQVARDVRASLLGACLHRHFTRAPSGLHMRRPGCWATARIMSWRRSSQGRALYCFARSRAGRTVPLRPCPKERGAG